MNLEKFIGLCATFSESETRVLARYINFKLAMFGLPVTGMYVDPEVEELTPPSCNVNWRCNGCWRITCTRPTSASRGF